MKIGGNVEASAIWIKIVLMMSIASQPCVAGAGSIAVNVAVVLKVVNLNLKEKALKKLVITREENIFFYKKWIYSGLNFDI